MKLSRTSASALAGCILGLLLATAPEIAAGPLDDHYLQRFNETATSKSSARQVSPESGPAERCGTPLHHGLKRNWKDLEDSTRKTLAKYVSLPVLSNEAVHSSAHFDIHYATSGTDAPPMADTSPANGVPDWVETVASVFEGVYSQYTTAYGYAAPPVSAASGRYQIYLRDLVGRKIYGITNSDQKKAAPYANSYSSWIEIDNNFTDPLYLNAANGPYTSLQSLQITAAHEFHHVIQYGYNYYFDVWFAEATSTWYEDELFDTVNQLYNYLPGWFNNTAMPLDTFSESTAMMYGTGYGRWLFNRLLAEQYGPAFIRKAWENLAARNSTDGRDIPMSTVLGSTIAASGSTLGAQLQELAKRVYRRNWSSHTAEAGRIHSYVPAASFSAYPVNAAPVVVLPRYSFAFYRFAPAASAPADLALSVSKTNGISATIFKKDMAGTITETPVAASQTTIPGFSTASETVLLLVNTTDTDGHQAAFSTDGSSSQLAEPVSTPETKSPVTAAAPSTGGGGGGGGGGDGCFIATAAYGSYLHPKVRLLRDFRDRHLLTSRPGALLVRCYYAVSPPLADFISQSPALRAAARILLTPLVAAVEYPAQVSGLLFAAFLIIIFRKAGKIPL